MSNELSNLASKKIIKLSQSFGIKIPHDHLPFVYISKLINQPGEFELYVVRDFIFKNRNLIFFIIY